MSSSTDGVPGGRWLRVAAVLLLVVVQGIGAASLHVSRTLTALDRAARPSREARHDELVATAAPPPMFPSLVGTLESYGDGTLDVLTVIERRRVRIDPLTSLFTPDARAQTRALRPGAVLAISGDVDAAGELVADVVVIRPPS